MRWCAQCRRYVGGQPRFCASCGRTFRIRLCPRGHVNRRGVDYCTDCGSEDLSTPAPPEAWLENLVHQIPIVGLPVTLPLLVVVLAVSVAMVIHWEQIVVLLVGIAIVLAGWHVAFQCLPPWFRR